MELDELPKTTGSSSTFLGTPDSVHSMCAALLHRLSKAWVEVRELDMVPWTWKSQKHGGVKILGMNHSPEGTGIASRRG